MIKKYKVWDKNKGEWNKSLLLSQDGEIIDIVVSGEGCITNIAKNDNDYEIFQSTGLTDKNGVEIYEGDIIEAKSGTEYSYIVGQVYFDKDFAFFGILRTNGGYWHMEDLFENRYWNDFGSVIGHIKTHPQLLDK